MNKATIDTSEMNVIFVHSSLDDYPLTPNEFRVYGHIARRAGGRGFYESVPNAAKHCHMSVNTYRRALHKLIGYGMLAVEERSGQTTLYNLTTPSQWKTPPKSTPGESDTPPKSDRATPTKFGRPPLPNLVDKGTPFKVIQEEENNPPTPQRGKSRLRDDFKPEKEKLPENVSADVWTEWCQHRREIKKPLRQTTVKRQLELLSKHSNDANNMLIRSIENGWQGIFPSSDSYGDRSYSAAENKPKPSAPEDLLPIGTWVDHPSWERQQVVGYALGEMMLSNSAVVPMSEVTVCTN